MKNKILSIVITLILFLTAFSSFVFAADYSYSFTVNYGSYENIDFDNIAGLPNNYQYDDSDPLATTYGVVNKIGNRMVKYTPSGCHGTDTFTFYVNQGQNRRTVEVTATVTCYDPPVPDCTYNVGYNCSTGEIIDMNGSVYDYVNVNRAAKICYPTANYKGSIFLVNPNPGTAVFVGDGNQIDYSLTNCSGLCGQTDTFTFLGDKVGAGGDIPDPITIKVNLTLICPTTPVRPVVDDDSESVCRDSCVNVSVLDGDTYTLPVTLVVDSGPTSPATATVSGNKINFCANNAEIGNYTFTYHIVQGNETSNTATVTVEVVDCSTTLFANDDSAEVCTETCTTINVLKNDVNYGTSPTINIVNGPPSAGGTAKVIGTGVSSTLEYCASEKPGVYSFTYNITTGQETSNEATVIVTVKDCTKITEKKLLPSSILYPGIDIIQLTVPSSGTNVIFGGKVVSPLEVAPGTQSLSVQVKNKGFLTQIDAGVRLEGLPQGVSFTIEPSTQKIKGHNIGTYTMTLTVPPTTPAGTYQIKAVSYSRRGTTDRVDLNLIVD